MRWNQRITAAVTAAGAAAAICTAGLAGPALAVPPAASLHFGTFGTWRGAQKAAKFKLIRPTRTYGLKRNGLITVGRCARTVTQKVAHADVTVSYGLTPFSVLSLSQNNSGGPCTKVGKVKTLGHVKVDGRRAVLSGKCGMPGLLSCKSKKIFLFLTWKKHGVYYVASSFGHSRKTLAGFAKGLRKVG